jgi:hypothetical protein
MEDFNKQENSVVELPPLQPLDNINRESEASHTQTDKIRHSSEQSSANISPDLGSTDSSMVLPAVDDSSMTNGQTATSTKINIVDEVARASDSDRIEKIWVDKAKAIIRNSAGDPHQKSENLSTEKTQYRNARFNKLISNQ